MATELDPDALIKKKQEVQKSYWDWKLDTKTDLENNLFNPTFCSVYIDFTNAVGSDGKESACNAETQVWSLGQEGLPTPIFLPVEFQRTLVGYSHGIVESDTSEHFHF